MMDNEIKEKIRTIIAQHLGRQSSELLDDTMLTEFGLESLDAIEIVFAIEEEFGIEIPYNANDPDTFNMATLKDVSHSVKNLISG
jgi:acyl carrier protein